MSYFKEQYMVCNLADVYTVFTTKGNTEVLSLLLGMWSLGVKAPQILLFIKKVKLIELIHSLYLMHNKKWSTIIYLLFCFLMTLET